ncbi:uncharacterized protein PS065_007958 isoform 2-T5 [Dugong dugon]
MEVLEGKQLEMSHPRGGKGKNPTTTKKEQPGVSTFWTCDPCAEKLLEPGDRDRERYKTEGRDPSAGDSTPPVPDSQAARESLEERRKRL